MSKVLVYTTPEDGKVHVVHPAPQSRLPEQTEAEWLAWVHSRSVPEGLPFHVMELSELPAYESATRHQWALTNGKVHLDPAKERPAPLRRVAQPQESFATQTKMALLEQELAQVRATQDALIRSLHAVNVKPAPAPGEPPA